MLDLELIGSLGQATSASGIVARGARLFVVADDRPEIRVYENPTSIGHDEGATAIGHGEPRASLEHVLVLEDTEMPAGYAERKAAKPDLEALAELPECRAWPHGALLTLGSGSTERRERGWLVALDGDGDPADVVALSLNALYDALRERLPDLNVEGAAVLGGALWLAQRGNGSDGFDALIELDLGAAVDGLTDEGALTAAALRGITPLSLGVVDDVPLTFSDLSPTDGGLLFCAVAEAVASTYDDGPCVGAGIGAIEPRSGEIHWFRRLREPHKIEGITPSDANLLLVADPDRADVPAPLFRVASETLQA